VPDFSRELIVVINEDQPELTVRYTLPECLLAETSEFFKAACRSDAWKEYAERTIKLLEVEPDTFNAYLLWVHRQEIPTAHPEEALELLDDLARLWLLGDRLADVRLRNAAMDGIVAEINLYTTATMLNAFPPKLIEQIWSSTTSGRPIRRLVVDYYVKHVEVEVMKAESAEYHHEFTKDLMFKAMKVVEDDDQNICPSNRDPDHYHDLDARDWGCSTLPSTRVQLSLAALSCQQPALQSLVSESDSTSVRASDPVAEVKRLGVSS
jgi:hypothetical protein